jgi:5'-phosphate synthase pdxT subunit
VLATANDHPVAVRQGKLLATSFHPELTGDATVHQYFFDEICR